MASRKPITLQFSTEKAADSAFIRWATWSDYSHVDVVLPDGKLLGARFDGGVQIRQPDYVKFSVTKRYTIPSAMPKQKDTFYKFLNEQCNPPKPYDWRGIINFTIHRKRDWKAPDSWFCSELVAAALLQAGIAILPLHQCDRVSPRDLTLSNLLEAV